MTFTTERFEMFLDFSDQQLQEAYSRMDMPTHAWTKGTDKEIGYILSKIDLNKESSILDLGCGQGRHCIGLAKKGFSNVTGIDFSESNISKARLLSRDNNCTANFITADVRKLNLGVKHDCILCLYDVIGSFRNDEDNDRIIRTVKRLLKKGGYAVISVMNMELTKSIAKNIASLSRNPESLLKLPPSETMESTGNIFNPDYFIINADDGLVYRKEQFTSGEEMFAEYLVADKRYTLEEITTLVENEGLTVVESRYVQAGKWEIPLSPTDIKAKEILLLVKNSKFDS